MEHFYGTDFFYKEKGESDTLTESDETNFYCQKLYVAEYARFEDLPTTPEFFREGNGPNFCPSCNRAKKMDEVRMYSK